MLTETKLKALKPKDKIYKISDRDGLYVTVAKSGLITFRFDYKINERRETLTIGKYGVISLSDAREQLMNAKKLLAQGVSPATENPAEYVAPSTIAIFNPRDRALSKREIGIFFNTLKNAQTSHALKVALKLLMLTMVRKSNLVNATWDEIDFVAAD